METQNNKQNKKNRTFTLTATAMLTAMIVILAFTPIGYIKVFTLSITLVIVPVIIGAIALGPAVGAFLGFVFGCTSFAQCFMGDVLGSILVSVNLIGTVVTCIVTRTLVGFLCGLIFKAVKDKTGKWSYAIAGVSGALLNTILFLGCLALIFGRVKFSAEQAESLGGLDSVMSTVIAIAIGVNCPIEAAVCAVFGSAIGGAVTAAMRRFSR